MNGSAWKRFKRALRLGQGSFSIEAVMASGAGFCAHTFEALSGRQLGQKPPMAPACADGQPLGALSGASIWPAGRHHPLHRPVWVFLGPDALQGIDHGVLLSLFGLGIAQLQQPPAIAHAGLAARRVFTWRPLTAATSNPAASSTA